MPRRGRSSPPPAPRRSSVPAHRPMQSPAPVQQAPPPAMAQPQQPSLFGQMAATAGGVAIGSAVGHTVGHALTGMFSGGGSNDAPVQQQQPLAPAPNYAQPAAPLNDPKSGPCGWEFTNFLKCAQEQSDLTLCEGFNEALRQCKLQHNIQ